MADDDKVFRLSFVLNAQQFNADVNQASANTISKIASIIQADGRFTDVTVQNIQKRSTAQTQGAAAANASLSTQAAALNKVAEATAMFGPATDRVVTFGSKLQSFGTLARNFGDPFVNEVNRTQKAVNDASAYLLKFENDAGKAVEAAIVLANAQKKLADAQTNLSTARTVTAGPGGENAAIEAIVKAYDDALNSAQAYARRGLDPVIAKHDALTASARSMTSELATVNKAFDSGVISQTKAVDLNNKIIESYNLAATEARKFAEEQAKVNATVQSILNPSTPGQGRNFSGGSGGGFGGPPRGGGGGPPFVPPTGPSGNDLRAAAVSSQNLIAGAKESAAQLAADTQAYYATILGISQSIGRVAKDSAAFFQEVADAERQVNDASDTVFRRLQELTATFDPATSSAMGMAKAVGELNEAQKLGVNIVGGYENALEQIRIKFGQVTEAELALQNAQSKSFAGTSTEANRARLVAAQTASPQTIAQGQAESNTQSMADNQSAINSLIGVNDKLTKSAQESAAAFETEFSTIEKASAAGQDDYERLSKAAQDYRERLNPLLEAQRRYNEAIAQQKEFVSVGLIPQKQATATIEDFTAKLKTLDVSMQQAAKSNLSSEQIFKTFRTQINQAAIDTGSFGNTSGKAFALARGGLLELQAAGVNTFQSLAAGISPLRTLETEGAQVLGGLFQLGLGLKTTLAVVAPLAAVAAAIAIVGVRILQTTNNLLQFKVTLDSIAKGTPATAAGLEAVVKNLEQTGSSATDAVKAVQELTKLTAQGFVATPPNVQRIGTLGRDIAAVTGGNSADEAIKLVKAITEGSDALIKYAVSLNALKGPELEFVTKMAEEGNRAGVIKAVIADLTTLYEGRHKQSLNSISTGFENLSAAYKRFIDGVADSRIWKSLETGAVSTINKIADAIGKLAPSWENAKTAMDQYKQAFPTGEIPSLQPAPGTQIPPGAASAPIPAGDAVQRLAEALIQAESQGNPVAVSKKGAFGLTQLLPGTASDLGVNSNNPLENVAGGIAYLGQQLAKFGNLSTALAAYNFGPGNVEKSQSTGAALPAETTRYIKQILSAAGLTGNETATQLGLPTTAQAAIPIAQQNATVQKLAAAGKTPAEIYGPPIPQEYITASTTYEQQRLKQNKADEDALRITGLLGVQQQIAKAAQDEFNRAIADGANPVEAQIAADRARTVELLKIGDQLKNNSTIQNLETEGTLRSTQATQENEVAGLRSLATEKARIENITSSVSIQQRANELLQEGARAAALAGATQIAATTPVLARQEALAKASLAGAQAEHEQTLQNQVSAETYDALTKAIAANDEAQVSGTDKDKQRTKTLLDLATAQNALAQKQVRAADVAQQVLDEGHILQQNKDQVQVLALQQTIQGQTTEEITKQVALLQLKQTIGERYNQLSDKQKQDLIDSVTRVQNFTIALAEVQRQQERINQLFISIGETISSSLGQVVSDIFSGQKITDWGTRLRQIISQIMTDIVQFTFIRPALGTALQAIGLGQAAQSFGSIGASTGIGGTGATSGIGGSSTLGTLGNVGGLLNSANNLGGGGSLFGTGGFSSFLNNLGGNLGFAVPGSPFSATIAGPSVPGALTAEAGAAQGSIFGSASLGSVLGGAGLGFGAGTLLNGILGGNQLGGTAGSGLGSLGGAAIGSLFGPIGTIIGGLFGGAGGGLLGGLFGNKRPSNAAGGAVINLGSGGDVSSFQSGGNSKNDQTAQQILSSVSTFTNQLITLTKGQVPGNVAVQAGTRGIQASFTGGVGSFTENFQDAASAINKIELQIAQGLTGVSDTLKTVLSHVTDPAQLQDAVAFANTYDDLKKAADNAFSSISTDVKTVGPFATALATLNSTFADLTDKANQFGLSLDPINAGLAEATKRLRDDFGKALDQALNTLGNSDFLNQLTTTAQAFASNAQEQQAIGLAGDQGTTSKVKQLEILQAQSVLLGLTNTQLKQVVDAFKTTNPEIAAMSQALIDAGTSLQDTTTSLTSFADGVKSVKDAIGTLTTGPLAGLSPQQQVTQARTAFQGQFAAVQASGTPTGTQLSQLATLATTAVQTAQNVYGNAPQTANLRNQILTNLNSVLMQANSSNAGTGVNPILGTSATVASAQAAAITAALHAAGVPGFAGGTTRTPSGSILVGEKGPEWMQVGMHGPEVINQKGGATILPFPKTPWQAAGRAFAEGTGDMSAITFSAPSAPSLVPTGGNPMVHSSTALLDKIDKLNNEVIVLRRITQGGQQDASERGQTGNRHLESINKKIAPPIVAPRRQNFG